MLNEIVGMKNTITIILICSIGKLKGAFTSLNILRPSY